MHWYMTGQWTLCLTLAERDVRIKRRRERVEGGAGGEEERRGRGAS
jgi:hypothetical protein